MKRITESSAQDAGSNPAGQVPTRVYQDYYDLAEPPFAITPDPDFLFFSSCHRQMLEKIGYAIEGRMGFILLTGEVGTGKTTLCRTLLDRWSSEADTVYVINPSISGHELLAGILEDLGATPVADASKKTLMDQLNQRLLANGTDRPTVVIIDDAQTMAPETLEDLRLLSNLETDKQKLIQVVLSGQPELLNLLAGRNLRQLKQRISLHCNLSPLPVRETEAYISRRLFVAGNQGQVRFSHAATRRIHQSSGGVPRQINKLCDFALTAGYVKNASVIDPSHVKRAKAELSELDLHTDKKGIFASPYLLSPIVLLLIAMGMVFIYGLDMKLLEASMPKASIAWNEEEKTQPIVASPDFDGTAPPCLPEATDSRGKAKKKVAVIKSTDAASVGPEEPAMVSEKEPSTPSRPPPAPYSLQLGSYRSLKNAKRGVTHFKKKGVAAHWQELKNGLMYRVVTGKFETSSEAASYKTAHGLEDAMIIQVPFTVKVMPGQPDVSDTEILPSLTQMGYNCLMERGETGDNNYYTGLFMSVDNASKIAERINDNGRLLAIVVTR